MASRKHRLVQPSNSDNNPLDYRLTRNRFDETVTNSKQYQQPEEHFPITDNVQRTSIVSPVDRHVESDHSNELDNHENTTSANKPYPITQQPRKYRLAQPVPLQGDPVDYKVTRNQHNEIVIDPRGFQSPNNHSSINDNVQQTSTVSNLDRRFEADYSEEFDNYDYAKPAKKPYPINKQSPSSNTRYHTFNRVSNTSMARSSDGWCCIYCCASGDSDASMNHDICCDCDCCDCGDCGDCDCGGCDCD